MLTVLWHYTCFCFVFVFSPQFYAILTFLTFGKTSSSGIDHCYDEPCKNNGSCVNSEDGYQCICSEKFTGARCEGKFNDAFLPRYLTVMKLVGHVCLGFTLKSIIFFSFLLLNSDVTLLR